MNIYKDLEDSLYNVIIELFPTSRIIFAYNNIPEPQTPYIVIDVKRLDQLGSEYSSTFVDIASDDAQTPTTYMSIDMMAKVRFEVVGLMDNDTAAAELAQNIQLALRTARGYESQARNNLARHGQITNRRMPYRKDTDMYMLYQVDANFAYTATSQDGQDYILTTDFNGVYHDANRPPDYVLESHVEINPNP
jgi:hypothetical protein